MTGGIKEEPIIQEQEMHTVEFEEQWAGAYSLLIIHSQTSLPRLLGTLGAQGTFR